MTDIPVYKFAVREDLVKSKISFLPTRAEPLATGWDVRAAFKEPSNKLIIKPNQYIKIPLGFRGFCPEGWWYNLIPRSSSFGKKSLHCLYGVIDETFPQELIFAAQYRPEKEVIYDDNHMMLPNNLIIEFGEAIGQIIPIKRQDMIVEKITNEELDDLFSKRKSIRESGFGSTDLK